MFSSGLAKNGMIPFFAVYSTFLQRSYDQLIHDVAMQDLKVVFCIDRAGFVGEDGESHQGIFDTAYLMSVPNLTIYSPTYFEELSSMMYLATYKEKHAVAIRYPRVERAKSLTVIHITKKSFLFSVILMPKIALSPTAENFAIAIKLFASLTIHF